jgi:pancreatic triacylglycerol lipase
MISIQINYVTARNRVGAVGAVVAEFADFLHDNNYLDFARTTFIGSSLGAHIVGMAGKSVRRGRVRTIIGCDPAGPLFNVNDPANRIAPGDGEHVECIHTDSRNFGIGAAICDGMNGGFPLSFMMKLRLS